MEDWFDSMPGGTHYTGRCPICGDENDSCSNGLCECCLSEQPRECPTCGCHYPSDQFGSHGQCLVCDEMDIQETINSRLLALDIDLKILNV